MLSAAADVLAVLKFFIYVKKLKLIKTLKNIWSIEELRGKILFTLMMIAIYRVGSHIVLPGIVVDPSNAF